MSLSSLRDSKPREFKLWESGFGKSKPASFALGGFSSRGKTSSDEGMGFFSTNASLQAHGGSQSGLDTIIGGSSSFSSSKRRHTSEDFERSVVRVDLKMNEKKLIQAFEASLRSTKEDWNEWIARISEQLLLESPSPSLRACSQLHQLHRQLSRELFMPFVSCWTDMEVNPKRKFCVRWNCVSLGHDSGGDSSDLTQTCRVHGTRRCPSYQQEHVVTCGQCTICQSFALQTSFGNSCVNPLQIRMRFSQICRVSWSR